MRFLAVPEVPSRGLWDAIRRRRQMATWHAVEERDPPARETLCGRRYASEAHRTWDQTLPDARCSQCEGRMAAPDTVRLAASTPEVSTVPPVKAELLKRRVSQGA